MTDEELDALRSRYAKPSLPPCRVCGADMVMGHGVFGVDTYYCVKADPLDIEHFLGSKLSFPSADERVIRLLDEYASVKGLVSRLAESIRAIQFAVDEPDRTCGLAHIPSYVDEACESSVKLLRENDL